MTISEFQKSWITKIENEYLKKFPEDFIDTEDSSEIKLPGKTLTIGSELFGSYEVVDSEGIAEFSVENYLKAKYIIYSNRNEPDSVPIPTDEEKLNSAVKEYENSLDIILRRIGSDFKNEFPESKDFAQVSSHIFSTLNLLRL